VKRFAVGGLWFVALPLLTSLAKAQAPSPSDASTARASAEAEHLFVDGLSAYRRALERRRLGQSGLRREDIRDRVAEAERLTVDGRTDEAIARLVTLVEDPRFDSFADSEEATAAVFRLGDALALAGIFEPARAYLRKILQSPRAWTHGPAYVWERRSVTRLVDVAIETGDFPAGAEDLRSVPANAPEAIRGEIAYMTGRAQETTGNPEAALAAYGTVTRRCRFWAQATYLSALIHVEHGRYAQGEKLLCAIADPKRSGILTPALADAKFFAVRDLARLGLGRIAHEEGRNDDARYYYYLVPQDSDRLAEALYEAATTRYEKKDYDGARELLDDLAASGLHHRYEDEAQILDAWVDLARCKFADADRKLKLFLSRYEPVRDAARSLGTHDVATRKLLAAVDAPSATAADVPGFAPEVIATVAALVRVDPAYDRVMRRRAVLEREASGLVGALGAIADIERALSTNGGVRPFAQQNLGDEDRSTLARDALASVEEALASLEAAHAPSDRVAPLRDELAALKTQAFEAKTLESEAAERPLEKNADLPDLLRADALGGADLRKRIQSARRELDAAELALARDALARLDLRLSRLLRRARLGRIESVLGRKRALEVEVEAIRLGYLPQDAVDSLDAGRYLEDSEEVWPFEGDDWPDEYVGGETQ
jgi:hypothetical protein